MSRAELKQELITKLENNGALCKEVLKGKTRCDLRGFNEVFIYHTLFADENRQVNVFLWDNEKVGHSSFLSSPFETEDHFEFDCLPDKKCRISFDRPFQVTEQDSADLQTRVWFIPRDDKDELKVDVLLEERKGVDHLDIRFSKKN